MICYIILTFSAIGDRNNVVSPSEMYHYIFQKKKRIMFFLEIAIEGTADQFYMHIYFTLILIMLFNISRL